MDPKKQTSNDVLRCFYHWFGADMSHTAFPKLSHVLAENTLPTVFLEHPMNVLPFVH